MNNLKRKNKIKILLPIIVVILLVAITSVIIYFVTRKNMQNEQNPITDLMQDNQIMLGNKNKLTFGIPEGYETERVADNMQVLYKGQNIIYVSSQYFEEDEYYNSLEDLKDLYVKNEDYKNVALSNKKQIKVGDKQFWKATLEFDLKIAKDETLPIKTEYFWMKISDEEILSFEVKIVEEITEKEIEKVLTINI